jgi:hypothetical protein
VSASGDTVDTDYPRRETLPIRELRARVNRLTPRIVKPRDAAAQQEEDMWQIHAQFRLGDIHTGEIDITPTLCLCFLLGTFVLMVGTGL